MTGANEGKIVVRPDPDVADLAPRFLEKRRKELDKLRKARQKNDFKTIEALAHRTAGLAGSYGFDDLSGIAKTLERAAINKETDAINQSIAEYAKYLDSVVIAD